MDEKTAPDTDAISGQSSASSVEEISKIAREMYFRRLRRIQFASRLEIALYFVVALLFVYRSLFYTERYFDLIAALTSPSTIGVLAAVFFSIFSLMLNGVTPVVGTLARNRAFRIEPPEPSFFPASKSDTDFRSEAEAEPEVPLAPPLAGRDRKPDSDPVEEHFQNYIDRSRRAVSIAQKRPNALLFAGTIIAFAGLIFFVLTLPGSRYGFLDLTPASNADLKTDFWASTVQLFPRLLMLIFIQVLAGFFLRQYRTSMEDFRYYESVLRHREAQYLSYTLRRKMGDATGLKKFADELLKEHTVGQVTRDHAILESQRAEPNEFTSMFERLSAAVASVEKKVSSLAKGRAAKEAKGKDKTNAAE